MSTKLTILAFFIFLAGLGLLLYSFIQIVSGLQKSKRRAYASVRSNIWLRVTLISAGMVFIVLSQAFFWFNSSLRDYHVLNRNIPLAQVSFIDSENDKPRMFLHTFNASNRPVLANEILLDDSLFQIEIEVIKFKNLGNLFGLNEFYRFSRLIYISDYDQALEDFKSVPLHDNGAKVTNVIRGMKTFITLAHTRTVLTDPMTLDSGETFEISYNDMGLLEVNSEYALSHKQE